VLVFAKHAQPAPIFNR